MKNIKFSRLFAAMMFVAVLSFAGCKQQPEEEKLPENVRLLSEDDGIVGKWEDNYPSWNSFTTYDCQIKTDFVELASYNNLHESTVYIKETAEDEGYIYFQFSQPINLWQIGDVDVTGKWGAIAYQKLTQNSVQMCDADYTDQQFASTLEECVAKYFKTSGYFAGISTPFTRVSE